MEKITVKKDTFLKQSYKLQASELSEDNKFFLPHGTVLEIEGIIPAPQQHTKLILSTALNNIITWYGFIEHFDLEGVEKYEETKLPKNPQPVTNFNFDSHSPIIWSNFQSKIGKYFTVGELLRNDVARIPQSNSIKENIIKIVRELDVIREEWGSGIGVTSGYRPPAVNRRVGGATRSQHLTGNAVDIFPLNGRNREFEKWLDAHWFGRLGYGQLNNRGFTHLDMANDKGWKTGGAKGVRWHY